MSKLKVFGIGVMRVRELCVEVNEDIYGRVRLLREKGVTLLDIFLKGLEYWEGLVLSHRGVQVKFGGCGVFKPYVYCWPPCRSEGDREVFGKAYCFEVDVNGRWLRFLVAYGFRKAYGKMRRRIVVFKIGRRGGTPEPVVEFAGADDYEWSRRIVSIIRRPDRKYMRLEDLKHYPEYFKVKHNIVDHASVIVRGRQGYAALCVNEKDVGLIPYHAITQYRWRKER